MTQFLEDFEEFEVEGGGYTNWMCAALDCLEEDLVHHLFDATVEEVSYLLNTDPDDISVIMWERLVPFAVSKRSGECLVLDDRELRFCSLPQLQGVDT
jgi:hypothetical protein